MSIINLLPKLPTVTPSDCPTEQELKQWAHSHWVEYQAWLFHHSFLTLHDWQILRHSIQTWTYQPLISLITPVFNTPITYLQDCIYSVQTQIYPHWELCLVDDGSSANSTLSYLKTVETLDKRIRLHHFPHNQGICQATNQAILMSHGDYLVFLDHDDRLAPDALYHLVNTLQTAPDTHILYSDRDMLSPTGLRFMHLFKPDWSPETLLSGNYLFHLVAYQRTIIDQLGGVQTELEGSQDYDLILRATDRNLKIHHIPKVLYHWRQHPQSVALQHDAKEYAYTAGLQALENTLKRRGLRGRVTENKLLWRGNYRVQFYPSPNSDYAILHLDNFTHCADHINQTFASHSQSALIILGPSVQPSNSQSLMELLSWLQIPKVSLVTGKILNPQRHLIHAGLVQRITGIPLAIYADFPETTNSYMAVTAISRNVSAPHPGCCLIRRSLWEELGGLHSDYLGPHALLDFALRALTQGYRTVYTPFAQFYADQSPFSEIWSIETDIQHFTQQWAAWLIQGDPYYSPHLTLELADMGLKF